MAQKRSIFEEVASDDTSRAAPKTGLIENGAGARARASGRGSW